MSTPIFKLLLSTTAAMLLVSCSKNDDQAFAEAEKSASQDAALNGKIACALAGATDFRRNCTSERIASQDGEILVIRHPDGGFRRFNILTDGRGLSPAQGFDETKIRILDDGLIELHSGDDRYRLPAQIKSSTQQSAPAQNAG